MKKKNNYKFKKIEYKSKGELEIAKFLDKFNIDFEYEFPVTIKEDNKTKIWYPDFYLKEYQIVIEYFGMYNHNKYYKDNAEFKKKTFQDCGIQFIPIYEIKLGWEEYVLKAMKKHQEIKLKKVYSIVEKFNKKSKFKILLRKLKFIKN